MILGRATYYWPHLQRPIRERHLGVAPARRRDRCRQLWVGRVLGVGVYHSPRVAQHAIIARRLRISHAHPSLRVLPPSLSSPINRIVVSNSNVPLVGHPHAALHSSKQQHGARSSSSCGRQQSRFDNKATPTPTAAVRTPPPPAAASDKYQSWTRGRRCLARRRGMAPRRRRQSPPPSMAAAAVVGVLLVD